MAVLSDSRKYTIYIKVNTSTSNCNRVKSESFPAHLIFSSSMWKKRKAGSCAVSITRGSSLLHLKMVGANTIARFFASIFVFATT